MLANDVEALPLAFRVADGAPVLFDAHEWAPAQYEHVRWWPLLMRPQVDALLRAHLPRVAGMMTVAPGIAERYEQHLRRALRVVTNAAPRADLSPTPPHDPIRLLHHGGAQPERRLELMIEAVQRLNGRATLDLVLLPTNPGYLARLRAAAEHGRADPVPRAAPDRAAHRGGQRVRRRGHLLSRRSTRTSSSPCPTSSSTSSRRAWRW